VSVELVINGGRHSIDASVGISLAEVLRDRIGLTGTKVACNEGHCGACTVLVDGAPTLSCITLVHRLVGREVTTIEGLREHPMVEAFVRADAVQCGYCTPGQIVSAVALVETTPQPTPDEIRHRMAGNLCRCGTYPKIEDAIRGVVGSTETPKSGGAGSPGAGAG
jgi:aerobic-type carbon monoxide dehydrogenase small subunit (CoxS/CutS family)